MNKIIARLLSLFLFVLMCGSTASAWQPSGWVYRAGAYSYSISDGDWYFDAPGWDHRVIGMSDYIIRDSGNEGWNYYQWPYVYSFSESQWFLTAEPGDEAWSVSLSTGIWSIFGDVSGPAFTGQILNFSNGDPVEGALISVQGLTGSSDAQGEFSIPGISAADRVVVSVTNDGFAPQSKIFSFDGEAVQETILILPASSVQTFDPSQAQVLDVEGSTASVELDANSLEKVGGGAPVGLVEVTLAVIDPGVDPDVMPGDFSVLNSAGLIESYGALSVEFSDANGADLDLANGETATICIPVPEGTVNPPSTIPLYYYDESAGAWVEEGSATLVTTPTGSYYQGTVAHFSTWNADKFYETAYIEGCVVDSEGEPVSNARVKSEGVDYNGTATAYTNALGEFRIPARIESLVLVSATKNGISTNTRSVPTGIAGSTYTMSSCLILGSTDSTATIKLTWGENPRDLDSHLTGPSGGGEFHVYYGSQGSLSAAPFANLDVDDTSSFGPEIITINQFENGTYTYYVRHFSGSANISASGARVELNVDGNISIFTPPAGATSSGDEWHVFELVVSNGSISVNVLQAINP